MAITVDSGNNLGTLNGTTEVELVPAPASGTDRMVRTITIDNVDTAAVTISVWIKKGASLYRVVKEVLQVDDNFLFGDDGEVLNLNDTDESVVAKMSGAAATTNPDFTAHWFDRTVT